MIQFLNFRGTIATQLTVNFNADHPELVLISPSNISIPTNSSADWLQSIKLLGKRPGHVEVIGSVFPAAIVDDSNLFIRVIVAHSAPLIIISSISGWIYFATWSISYYPQIWLNIRRKSVVGLDFDYLALNLLGHTLYTLFNFSLYFITPIENEYFERFPRGLNPVKINDVVYSIHALTLTIVTIGTCFVYEVSNSVHAQGKLNFCFITFSVATNEFPEQQREFFFIFFTIIIVTFSIAAAGVFHWLDFLYICSYIKLAITPIKYIPQVVTHYREKSTAGWSISAVNLDVVGGVLSMLQMILNSYNYSKSSWSFDCLIFFIFFF